MLCVSQTYLVLWTCINSEPRFRPSFQELVERFRDLQRQYVAQSHVQRSIASDTSQGNAKVSAPEWGNQTLGDLFASLVHYPWFQREASFILHRIKLRWATEPTSAAGLRVFISGHSSAVCILTKEQAAPWLKLLCQCVSFLPKINHPDCKMPCIIHK